MLLGDDGLLVGGLLVDDLVVEGAGGTGWAAVLLVLRDLLLASPSVGGLLVDDGLLGNGSLICVVIREQGNLIHLLS